MYIWQADEWPHFVFDIRALSEQVALIEQQQQRLLGQVARLSGPIDKEAQMDALIQNAIRTSAIEGEKLDVGSVRSSVAKHLGLETVGVTQGSQYINKGTKQTDALVSMLLSATSDLQLPLSESLLCDWQSLLFPEPPLIQKLIIGKLRGDEPMQVVSQKGGRELVHFEAPPKVILHEELSKFLDWFNTGDASNKKDTHGLIRAGIAHLWFVTLHPFDDGNGRLARAITDRALAQAENTSVRFYSMSASIEANRNAYYDQLEAVQNIRSSSQQQRETSPDAFPLDSSPVNITTWLVWFLQILADALEQGSFRIDRVMAKSEFWYRHSQTVLSVRQIKVLNRLLDGYGEEFQQGINAGKYQSIAKVSKATATRDLTELVQKGCLKKLIGGGRSTRYRVLLSPNATCAGSIKPA